MKWHLLAFAEDRKTHQSAFLRTAQTVYCHVVLIQRVFKRFLARKRYILCIYSMSWIVAEKRYLAQLKKSDLAQKEYIQRMTI